VRLPERQPRAFIPLATLHHFNCRKDELVLSSCRTTAVGVNLGCVLHLEDVFKDGAFKDGDCLNYNYYSTVWDAEFNIPSISLRELNSIAYPDRYNAHLHNSTEAEKTWGNTG